jgi:hypothetical protein
MNISNPNFGPDGFPKQDREGRPRLGRDHFEKTDVWDVLHAVRKSVRPASDTDDDRIENERYYTLKHAEELEERLVGEWRPVDDILQRLNVHLRDVVVPDFAVSPAFRPRLTVRADTNFAGNLVVTVSPAVISPRGTIEKAGEWGGTNPFERPAERAGRPYDEILFMRRVEGLMLDKAPKLSALDEERRAMRAASAAAVNFAFWLEIFRLEKTFDLSFSSFVTMIPESVERDEPACVDIVDAPAAHRRFVQATLDRFEELTGLSPDHFLDVCDRYRKGTVWTLALQVLRADAEKAAPPLDVRAVQKYYKIAMSGRSYGLLPKPRSRAAPPDRRKRDTDVKENPDEGRPALDCLIYALRGDDGAVDATVAADPCTPIKLKARTAHGVREFSDVAANLCAWAAELELPASALPVRIGVGDDELFPRQPGEDGERKKGLPAETPAEA